jgi:hypothetical protein
LLACVLTRRQRGTARLAAKPGDACGRAFGRRSYIAGQWPHEGDALVRWSSRRARWWRCNDARAMGAGVADARAMAAYLKRLR